MCFDGVGGCRWRGGVQYVLMGWQGANGEVVFSVFNGVAGCKWRGGVQCVLWGGRVQVERWCSVCLMGWQGAGGEAVFTVEASLLRSGLQRFPKLLSALLPPDADTSRFDINVYQLLRVSGERAG